MLRLFFMTLLSSASRPLIRYTARSAVSAIFENALLRGLAVSNARTAASVAWMPCSRGRLADALGYRDRHLGGRRRAGHASSQLAQARAKQQHRTRTPDAVSSHAQTMCSFL